MNLLKTSLKDLKKAINEQSVQACVVGLGYVGLPLAVILGESGFMVTGVDKNQEVIKRCQKGSAHFYEKGLDEKLLELLQRGMINFSTDVSVGTRHSAVIFITVGSPLGPDGAIDTTALEEVSTAIGKGLTQGKLVIVKSTLSVGGTRRIVKPILEDVSRLAAEQDFGLAFVPERTVEGRAMEELVNLPKIVAGVGERSKRAAQMIYRFIGGPLVPVSCLEVAEAAKLFDNVYRDVNVALANELAIVCERLGVDAIEAIQAANREYPRNNILTPGVGVGGSCLTKDSYILAQDYTGKDKRHSLILRARRVNDTMPQHFVSLIKDAFFEMNKALSGSRIAVLGYAMKSDTSDTRDTPVKKVVQWLKKENAQVRLYDPLVSSEAIHREVGIQKVDSLEAAVHAADAICIVTDHKNFLNLDLSRLRSYCQSPSAIIDGRHIVAPQAALSQGFIFRGVGRPYQCFEVNQ